MFIDLTLSLLIIAMAVVMAADVRKNNFYGNSIGKKSPVQKNNCYLCRRIILFKKWQIFGTNLQILYLSR